MSIKYLKPKYYHIVLIIFSIILFFGLFVLIAKIDFIPWTVMLLSILAGGLGTLLGLMMTLYWFTIIYEAAFELSGISVVKANKDIYLAFNEIEEMDYIKPTIFNYLISLPDGLNYPGRLSIKINKKDGKRSKIYLIKLKQKDYKQLPQKYKDKIKIR